MKVKRPEPSNIPDPSEPRRRPVILRRLLLLLPQNLLNPLLMLLLVRQNLVDPLLLLLLLLVRQNLLDPLHLLLGRLRLVRATPPPYSQRVPLGKKRGGTHRVPTLIDVCTRTTPIACTTACAWPTARITSSHEPSIVVPAECIVHLRPLARSRRWTAATSRATEGVEVPICGGG